MISNNQATRGLVRLEFDKNSAADYLSARLQKEISGEAVRQLHIRGTCPAESKFSDGRLKWLRPTLDAYLSQAG